jgi:hypothetical protein
MSAESERLKRLEQAVILRKTGIFGMPKEMLATVLSAG